MRVISLITLLMFTAASKPATLDQYLESVETITVPATVPAVSRVFVFTDTSCPYCMLLHQQRDEFLQNGIDIEYLFYPRTGPEGEAFRQAVAVWCSKDRLAALETALRGITLPEADCEHPVREHYELARQLRLLGTPAIVTETGSVIYGLPSSVPRQRNQARNQPNRN